ncbi:unnamed protein product [Vicia faba]|uniref:Uncharacterized protein n=1 Tax=Vicia faba TaxID=3906 RepID=A0AAV1ALU5_VICFA|nr:unnamed protein product [Vicia faba]
MQNREGEILTDWSLFGAPSTNEDGGRTRDSYMFRCCDSLLQNINVDEDSVVEGCRSAKMKSREILKKKKKVHIRSSINKDIAYDSKHRSWQVMIRRFGHEEGNEDGSKLKLHFKHDKATQKAMMRIKVKSQWSTGRQMCIFKCVSHICSIFLDIVNGVGYL